MTIFSNVAERLQAIMILEARKIYSEKVIQFSCRPENFRRMSTADAAAVVKGMCGDTMEIYLKIASNRISDASFFTDGCGATLACGSIVTMLAKEERLEETLAISSSGLIDELGGLPRESIHCAILAVSTLYRAIADYLMKP